MANPPDDPFAPSDATILRPRPGRRPAAGPQPGAAAAPGAAPPLPLPPAAPAYPMGSGPGIGDFIAAGANPIVQSAVPLLVLAGRLRGQIANADLESLRRQC